MRTWVSCPRCDAPVAAGEPACPGCGFAVLEQRFAGRGLRRRGRALGLGAAALGAVAAAALTLPGALTPASRPISGAEAERLLGARYPAVGDAPHSVIACPDRRIEPGGEARCWILPRVGQQRAAVVRLSSRGNAVEIDD
jgi:hypothetical protein